MECFRIDESGYTGADLLNTDQRFQGAAAIAIRDEEAAHLVKKHFPNLKASELKYRALSKRPANHKPLLALLSELLSNYKSVTYVCDKCYLLILMFLEYAVEPYYFERGCDFYEDGQNYMMGSVLAVTSSTLLGKSEFEHLLASFQKAVKTKSSDAMNELVAAAKKTQWHEFPEALGPLAQYAAPECLSAIATPSVTTDAAFVVLLSLISRMEVMCDGPYRVEHDRSKNLESYNSLLQRFINHENKIELRQSEIASFKFPLKLYSVKQVDSKLSPAVQLADVMVGAAVEAANTITRQRTGGLDPDALLSLYSENQLIHLIPSINFDEQKRFRKGTQASHLINYFAKNFKPKK